MNKIMLKVKIVNNNNTLIEEVEGKLNNQRYIIEYVEKFNTKVVLDMFNNILIRENDTIHMKLSFDLNKITENELIIKEFNKKVNLSIKTKKISRDSLTYSVTYNVLNGDSFQYTIELFNK